MGYFGRIQDKLRVQKLRRQGLSYKEILTKIYVSKDTISRWCKDIELTEEQKLRLLKKKQFGQIKGSIIAAENKRKLRIERTERIRKEAKKDVAVLSKRDKFIAGIALYAAEGDKADRKGGFSNADPELISFMMNWFSAFTNLPLSRMRGAIWLHEGLDELKAKEFWSVLTGIPSKSISQNIYRESEKTIVKRLGKYTSARTICNSL